MEKLKVVPDTGFILQATLNSTGPAGKVLGILESGSYVLLMSPQVREEIEDVLGRPSLRVKYPRLDDGRVEAMMMRLDNQVKLVTVIKRYIEFPRDPNDEPILNLAIQEQANYIIARDNDLIDLGSGTDFRLLYPYLHIVNPVKFLYIVETSDPQNTLESETNP